MKKKRKLLINYLVKFNEENLEQKAHKFLNLAEKRFTIKAGWSSLNSEKRKSTRRAMNEYRKNHTCCEITGSNKKVQIHHIVPVWANPDIADDPNNFIALSASAHIHHIYGHHRNFAKKYVKNIREISNKMLALHQEFDIVHRNDIQTHQGKENLFKEWKAKISNFWFDT